MEMDYMKISQSMDLSSDTLTPEQRAIKNVDRLNNTEGDLDKTIYDCPKCKNKGFVYTVKPYFKDFMEVARECDCKPIRISIIRMKKSGLEPIIKKCTFDKYEATEAWQKSIKSKAETFVDNVDNLEHKWFYIGGGIGCGKTHLCTAIVKSLLDRGKSARYMQWVNDSAKLKSLINEPDYEDTLNEFRKVEVLYIDDFLKITKDNSGNEVLPTSADIRLAYEIINYRYQHDELITVISSERYAHEVEQIDSAVGSRILEKCQQNVISVSRDSKRNYRLRNLEII